MATTPPPPQINKVFLILILFKNYSFWNAVLCFLSFHSGLRRSSTTFIFGVSGFTNYFYFCVESSYFAHFIYKAWWLVLSKLNLLLIITSVTLLPAFVLYDSNISVCFWLRCHWRCSSLCILYFKLCLNFYKIRGRQQRIQNIKADICSIYFRLNLNCIFFSSFSLFYRPSPFHNPLQKKHGNTVSNSKTHSTASLLYYTILCSL